MKRRFLVFLLPLVVCAGACKTTKKAAATPANTADLITDQSFRKPIIDKDLYKSTTEIVPLDTVYIASDTLTVVTKRIAGCESENFKLIWNGSMAKSLPPQTSVKLFQLVDGACTERHKFHLTYNISALKFKNDTAADKSTLIRVGGWGKMLNYKHH